MKLISSGVFLCVLTYANVSHLKNKALMVCLRIKVIHIGRKTKTGKKHKELTLYHINLQPQFQTTTVLCNMNFQA
jgi:hypothetical protein